MNADANAELCVSFSNLHLLPWQGISQRAAADVQLTYLLNGTQIAASEPFLFTAPLGTPETDELRWYLESYYVWPTGLFRERAERLEQNLPQWGEQLLAALISTPSAEAVFQQWLHSETSPLLSLQVLTEDTPTANTAASRLLGFPWELLRHDRQYLADHQPPVRIRRNLALPAAPTSKLQARTQASIRILTISPRPAAAGYIDHRASTKPLLDALESLGNSVEVVMTHPPTFAQMQHELWQAEESGTPFHTIHFDGHGMFDAQTGQGALCFEHEQDQDCLLPETIDLVYADELTVALAQYQIPLVFLEACQTGQSDEDPHASVAAALLQAGVSSVIAMSHSVLVETARRFVSVFYRQLASGQPIGTAVIAARQYLMQDTSRINIPGAGDLQMQDWFVPVLYQQQNDSYLFGEAIHLPTGSQASLSVGELPQTPPHTFIGRSRELLALERLLNRRPYAVIRGMSGMGKTALAVELAHWLLRCRRFERCTFVSADDPQQTIQALRNINGRSLLVIDNMESLLADQANAPAVLELLAKSQPPASSTQNNKGISLLFTTRVPLPAPFDDETCEITLDALSPDDAKTLVMQVMHNTGLNPTHSEHDDTPKQVNALVETVGCHPRALVLLARELAQTGAEATAENIRQIMHQLHKRYPDQRELSLFASVEQSLRHLTPDVQKQIAGLAVFHGGGCIFAPVLGVDRERNTFLMNELIGVGLADYVGDYGYIRLAPALPAYLATTLDATQYAEYHQRWLRETGQLLDFLYAHYFQDIQLAMELTQLDLPNLMACLQTLVTDLSSVQAQQVLDKATKLEQLLAKLNRPQELTQVVAWRKQAAALLNEWSHIRFENERMNAERLLEQGDIPAAYKIAQTLLQQAQQAGEQAYTNADYDLALACTLLGRVLQTAGADAEALPHLQDAQLRFEKIGDSAARMAAVTLLDQGDCLCNLGQLEAATSVYEESIERSEKLGNIRAATIGKTQLAHVYLEQNRYADALRIYQEALAYAQQLNEPGTSAIIWHQIGMTCLEAGDYPLAEQAYRQALIIDSRQGNRSGEANALDALGVVYDRMGKTEDSIQYHQSAADIYTELNDLNGESRSRNNLAIRLSKLGRYDEARPQLQRTLECAQAFGYTAEPWKTWNSLYELELACGNQQAAHQAYQQAVNTYLAYRRDGGENHEVDGRLCADIFQAIRSGQGANFAPILAQLLHTDAWRDDPNLLLKLQAIVAGSRDFSLATDAGLFYRDAVEIQLLLEQLHATNL